MSKSYVQSEVASMLGVTAGAVTSLCELVHGARRESFTPDDLRLMRAAQGLLKRRISKARIVEALASLKAGPAEAEPVRDEGREVVIKVGAHRFNAQSGQALMDMGREPAKVVWLRPATTRNAEQLFAHAVEVEERNAPEAIDAYEDALAADPYHADAHVNLGRVLHQTGRLPEAEAHYQAALVARPDDVTATFNLAVVLEDLGRADDAMARYSDAIRLDPNCVDAYFNLSRLYEKKGEKMAAIRHLKDYRRLSGR